MNDLVHPDPAWHKRLSQGYGSPTDICQTCPHVRSWHDDHGCRCPHSGQFDARPCACTNKRGNSLYGLASSLRQLTARGGWAP